MLDCSVTGSEGGGGWEKVVPQVHQDGSDDERGELEPHDCRKRVSGRFLDIVAEGLH